MENNGFSKAVKTIATFLGIVVVAVTSLLAYTNAAYFPRERGIILEQQYKTIVTMLMKLDK